MALRNYLDKQWVLEEYQNLDWRSVDRWLKENKLYIDDIKEMIEVKESARFTVSKKKE